MLFYFDNMIRLIRTPQLIRTTRLMRTPRLIGTPPLNTDTLLNTDTPLNADTPLKTDTPVNSDTFYGNLVPSAFPLKNVLREKPWGRGCFYGPFSVHI